MPKDNPLNAFICTFLSHRWSDWKLDKKKCRESRNCGRCGKHEKRDVQHAWNDWAYQIQTEDNFAAGCLEMRECQHCKQVEHRSQSGHDWDGWVDTPNLCRETRRCKRCGYVETRSFAHTWGEWAEISKQCNETHKCKRCGEIEIRPLPHVWEKAEKLARAVPNGQEVLYSKTCTLRKCSCCGAFEKRSREHAWEGKVERLSPDGPEVVFSLTCKYCLEDYSWHEKILRPHYGDRGVLCCSGCGGHEPGSRWNSDSCDRCQGIGYLTLDERKGQIKEKYGISHFVDQVVFIRGLDFDFSERDEEMDAYLHSY